MLVLVQRRITSVEGVKPSVKRDLRQVELGHTIVFHERCNPFRAETLGDAVADQRKVAVLIGDPHLTAIDKASEATTVLKQILQASITMRRHEDFRTRRGLPQLGELTDCLLPAPEPFEINVPDLYACMSDTQSCFQAIIKGAGCYGKAMEPLEGKRRFFDHFRPIDAGSPVHRTTNEGSRE